MTHRSPRLLFAAALLAGLGACHRQEVIVYMAPKDAPDAPEAGASEDPAAANKVDTNAPLPRPRAELPKLTWKLPAGWSETGPGQMSVASFAIDVNGAKAGVAITPMPNMAGQEPMIVNMWRQQAGAPDLDPAQAEAALTPVPIAGDSGKFFEISSERDGKASRIVTAMFNRGSNTWFFKLQGDATVVEAQKPAFLEFLKSVQFEDKAVAAIANPPPPPDPSAPAPAPEPAGPVFPQPEGWRKRPAGQMQVARYAVPEQGEAAAEVTVSMFTSDTGGAPANVARWRRQLGMPELPEAEVAPLIKPIEGLEEGADGVYTDLTQGTRRLIGAIVHRGGQWWFFKLLGEEPAVAAARETFLNFAKSLPKS
ncbi:MAG TPA: hypothetical protein VGO11_24845 [Chthoniobacteraceae bacterium]|jgi:hypothetical protein|nr:hypothetical protein [Chthoniobacteraceae bacterium]